ncbi:alpha-E domain-containing protein [Aliiruegeria sabulilitoris]|uniref:alpha-E domain-containing protein n=1 Tax=Aliiruegeria sabulilitoris TaxID=1510458 RepID=UPI00083246E2|nr:alpha-E domain-containing protein [Aliiruegeria sabulilitoris]NDR58258.1 alpha-E domain-containing protein [Pseudoruegeria sp. M32A2M]
MLGKTAGGLTWMFRYLERCETMSRLIETGFRNALTRPATASDEWAAVLDAAGVRSAYLERHQSFEQSAVVDFLLRDCNNPSSVMSCIEHARNNARLVRTALSREVWEVTNDCWMTLKAALGHKVRDRDLPAVLSIIRQQNALVRGATHGTMLRNDIFNFCRIGTFMERADATARILDVKYYVLLPSISHIGSALDNVQWENILRSVGAHSSYRWLNGPDISALGIAEFLILDHRMPRSLAFCIDKVASNLCYLEKEYATRNPSQEKVAEMVTLLAEAKIDEIFDEGLHEFILDLLADISELSAMIETDYRFYE